MEPGTSSPDGTGERKTSRSYLGCGCAAVMLLGLAGFTGLTWVGFRAGKQMEAGFRDPEARVRQVREILPYEQLPAGYHPFGAISIPLVMKTVILSDREPETQVEEGAPDVGERGFFYTSFLAFGSREEGLKRFVQGGQGDGAKSTIDTGSVKFEVGRPIRTGSFTAGGGQVQFGVYRGDAQTVTPGQRSQDAQRGEPAAPAAEVPPAQAPPEEDRKALVALLQIKCPQDNRARMGIWFTPDPAPGQPTEGAAFAGSPADPQAIERFAGHFQFCPR
ncbi:MAG TPA: hypothetical protein VHN15_14520 [Thermoanaerobaculia bacterium]|nr:hypothetical protein [Thermoanaerobaculia bacterium]